MSKKELENLRRKIDIMIVSGDTDSDDLLKASQELDIMIIEYMKKHIDICSSENEMKKVKSNT